MSVCPLWKTSLTLCRVLLSGEGGAVCAVDISGEGGGIVVVDIAGEGRGIVAVDMSEGLNLVWFKFNYLIMGFKLF